MKTISKYLDNVRQTMLLQKECGCDTHTVNVDFKECRYMKHKTDIIQQAQRKTEKFDSQYRINTENNIQMVEINTSSAAEKSYS